MYQDFMSDYAKIAELIEKMPELTEAELAEVEELLRRAVAMLGVCKRRLVLRREAEA